MKKTLDTLIRLQRNEIDRLRGIHNALLDQQDVQFKHIEQIADNLIAEQAFFRDGTTKAHLASVAPAPMGNYGNFSRRMMNKKALHEDYLRQLEPKIEASQAALSEAFAERKRYEILNKRKQEAELTEQKEAEQQFLDENTILRYQRSFD